MNRSIQNSKSSQDIYKSFELYESDMFDKVKERNKLTVKMNKFDAYNHMQLIKSHNRLNNRNFKKTFDCTLDHA